MVLCPGILDDNICLHPSNCESTIQYGTRLLGSPIGSDDFIKNFLNDFISQELPSEFARLNSLTSLQSIWTYFYYIVNNKITHLLRTITPTLTQQLISSFQQIQLQFIYKICDIQQYESTFSPSALFYDQL
jgi:hypothetical protein